MRGRRTNAMNWSLINLADFQPIWAVVHGASPPKSSALSFYTTISVTMLFQIENKIIFCSLIAGKHFKTTVTCETRCVSWSWPYVTLVSWQNCSMFTTPLYYNHCILLQIHLNVSVYPAHAHRQTEHDKRNKGDIKEYSPSSGSPLT